MLLLASLLTPLLGGVLLAALPLKQRRTLHLLTLTVTLLTSALTAVLFLRPPAGEETVLLHFPAPFTLAVAADGRGRVFGLLLAFLWPLAVLYATEYMRHETREKAFFAWYTLSYAPALGAALSANLFSLYFFFELLTLSTLPLVTHKRDVPSIRAGRKYLLYSLSGATLAFCALSLLAREGIGLSFRPGGAAPAEGTDLTLLRGAFAAAFLGFAVKAAIFPLHAWLPAASAAPTPVTALLHAVAVVNCGAFACIRLIYDACGPSWLFGSWAQTLVLSLSALTVVFGAVMAVREKHLKRRLAWSTVSNLSYMLAGAALMTSAGLRGALLHMLAHGLTKITLFYCAGAVLIRSGREYVSELRGLRRAMPMTFAAFTLAALSLLGVPPLAGFLSKWNLLQAAAESGIPMGFAVMAALILSTVLTAFYALSVPVTAAFLPEEAHPFPPERLDPSWRITVPLLILCLAVIALGVSGSPLTI